MCVCVCVKHTGVAIVCMGRGCVEVTADWQGIVDNFLIAVGYL